MTMQELFKEYLIAEERLTCAIEKYEHGCSLLEQVSSLNTTYFSPSVESYFTEVKESGIIPSFESLVEVKSPVIDTIGRILKAIYDAIVWIIKALYDLFRWIFDMYYRVQRKFVKQQQFLLQFIDPVMRDKFNNSSMTTVTYADFVNFNKHLNNLILTLQSGSRVASFDHIERLFVDSETSMGVKLNVSEIINVLNASGMEKTGILSNLGWTYDTVSEVIAMMILTAHDTVTLKRLNTSIIASTKELEGKVDKAVKSNAHPATVNHFQEQLGMQRQLHAFVKSGLTVVATRMIWMDKYFSAFINRMREIQSNK